jgi:hypothetical protein
VPLCVTRRLAGTPTTCPANRGQDFQAAFFVHVKTEMAMSRKIGAEQPGSAMHPGDATGIAKSRAARI